MPKSKDKPEDSIADPQGTSSSSLGRQLDESTGITTSRVGRFLKTGWAARHAIPMAFKRTADLLSAEKKDRKDVAEKLLQDQEAIAEELFQTLGNLKGVVQKFGQLASYLEGVLPPELAPVYQRVLSRLQDAAPALPPLATQEVIEDELDCLIEDVFPRFESQPFAAASVGQVHRAWLADGTAVAVKVQYPNIDKAFASDLKNIKMMEMMFAPVIRYYRGRDVLADLRKQLLDELDYEREATMQEAFRKSFEGHPTIHIPKVFPEYSTKKLLVTEFVEGITFRELEEADEEIRHKASETIARYYMDSLFVHHLVNVDPHPGNYVFHSDGKVSFLDFGAAVPVDPERSRELGAFILAYCQGDTETFRAGIHEIFGVANDDPVVFEAYEAMFAYYLQPFAGDLQPFAFSTGWIESCVEESMTRSKAILLRGGRIPKLPPPPTHINPDLPVVYRVAVGLGSLLARLRVAIDWPALLVESMKQET
ncbi:MAG: AarF/ABC1/UbiB kinase family protein [Deltaproteobacteria bacterium]|nr:MAG: AarF/ABC1/UbiB kinase family protein [Deltaproteobacteria bacterium]